MKDFEIDRKINLIKAIKMEILELEAKIEKILLRPSIARIIMANPDCMVYLDRILSFLVIEGSNGDYTYLNIDDFTLEQLIVDLCHINLFIDNKLDSSCKTDSLSLEFYSLRDNLKLLIDCKIKLLVTSEPNFISAIITFIKYNLLKR